MALFFDHNTNKLIAVPTEHCGRPLSILLAARGTQSIAFDDGYVCIYIILGHGSTRMSLFHEADRRIS